MAINVTYFVHGTTTDNEQGISTGWNQGELSELGIEQSKQLRDQVKGKKFDVIFCSDLKRAVDSAHLAFEGIAPIVADERLRECNYGKFNGHPSDFVEPVQQRMIVDRFPQGESCEDVKTRLANFLSFLRRNYDGQSVAIVSHKAPQLALDVLLKGKTWEQAFAEDWRNTKSWQPGWEYILE